jgi:hypothetical protein
MSLRIDPQLHAELSSRSVASGRPMTTVALRLIRKGMAQEEALGTRADRGFDLMLAYSIRGPRGVLEELLKTEDPRALQQHLTGIVGGSGKAA